MEMEEAHLLVEDRSQEDAESQTFLWVKSRGSLFGPNLEIISSKLEFSASGGSGENSVATPQAPAVEEEDVIQEEESIGLDDFEIYYETPNVLIEVVDLETDEDQNEVEVGARSKNQSKPKPGPKVKPKKRVLKTFSVKTFQCGECEYKTKQKISLTRHILSLHSGQVQECECGKQYRWQVDLRRHREAAHSGKMFACRQCEYQGKSSRSLRAHEKARHSETRPDLTCPTCGAEFSSKGGLEVHINKHLGLRETCLECGNSFSSQSVLLRHMKQTHLEGNLVTCPSCQKTFTRTDSLTRHVKTAHGE